MKKSTIVVAVVAILVFLGVVLWYQMGNGRTVAPPRDVEIDTRYDTKIVYTTNTGLDPEPFMAHCRDEGGTFNSCGTICEPGAAFCAEICAYTCELNGDVENMIPPDTRTWIDYTNDEYGFSLRYPSEDWSEYEDTSSSFSPKYNFYTEPAGSPVSLPLTHHDNVTHTSVYPLGIPTEGVFGETVPLAFDLPFEVSDESRMYVLESGVPFAAMIVPADPPTSWNDSGFIWVRAYVRDYQTECMRGGSSVAADVCDPLVAGDRIIHRGGVDTTTWARAAGIAYEVSLQHATAEGSGEDSMIVLASPKESERISSPLSVTGEARGPWFFEASFPVVLTDWDGRIIAEAPAQAQGSWMTESFVPYTATLTFESPYQEGDPEFMQRGSLILQKANPSGLPENDDAYEITVRFAPSP